MSSSTPEGAFKRRQGMVNAVLARIITRMIPTKMEREAQRLQILKNFHDAPDPDAHLAAAVQMADGYYAAGRPPTFEVGLLMGSMLALCACSPTKKQVIRDFLDLITKEQETRNEESKSEEKSKEENAVASVCQQQECATQPVESEAGRLSEAQVEPTALDNHPGSSV